MSRTCLYITYLSHVSYLFIHYIPVTCHVPVYTLHTCHMSHCLCPHAKSFRFLIPVYTLHTCRTSSCHVAVTWKESLLIDMIQWLSIFWGDRWWRPCPISYAGRSKDVELALWSFAVLLFWPPFAEKSFGLLTLDLVWLHQRWSVFFFITCSFPCAPTLASKYDMIYIGDAVRVLFFILCSFLCALTLDLASEMLSVSFSSWRILSPVH